MDKEKLVDELCKRLLSSVVEEFFEFHNEHELSLDETLSILGSFQESLTFSIFENAYASNFELNTRVGRKEAFAHFSMIYTSKMRNIVQQRLKLEGFI